LKHIFTLLLLHISAILIAQSNKCILLDKESNLPIAYANICFENIEETTKLYTTTSIDGSFEYLMGSNSIIAISYVGYKTFIDTIDQLESKTFYLIPDFLNLEQVVVTATRSNKLLKDAPVITQLISAKRIEDQGFTNVQEVLNAEIPGLEFQTVGFGTDINMQGLNSKNILILIDGEQMAGENGNNIDYSRLNTNNIERIEIVKGASSALYGSQAMGGVINIITKSSRKKISIQIGGKIKANNQLNFPELKSDDDDYFYKSKLDLLNLNLNAAIGFNLNKLSGRTDFNTKSSDAYQLVDAYEQYIDITNIDTTIIIPPATTNIDGYEDFTISQKLKYKFSNKLEFNANGSFYKHNRYDFHNDNKYDNFNDITYGASINYKPNKKLNLRASFNSDTYNKYYYFEKLDEKELNYKNIFFNPKLIGIYSFNNKNTLTLGAEFLHEYLLTDKFTGDTVKDKSVNTSVMFAQDDIDITDNINLIAGLRADYHSTFGLHISPKVSIMYKYKNHRFRLNYANGFRSPTLKELYMNWNLLGMFTIKGDENLQPESNQYLSASAEYSHKNLNGSVNIYNNWFKNKIVGEWKNNQTVYQYVNVGHSTLTGLELLLKYRFLKYFNISGGYSYVIDQRNDENQMASSSPHAANLRFEYGLLKKFYNLNIIISGKITGAKNYATYQEKYYQGDFTKFWYDVHYDPYSIWNLSISQKIYNRFSLIIGIDNILDYKAEIINFNTSINPGRRAFVSMRYEF